MGCACKCAAWVIKYFLFFVNVLFVLSGITIIVLGTVAYVHFQDYDVLLQNQFSGASIAVIAIGCLIFVVASCGCCGAITENRCLLITYGSSLLILLACQVAAGTWALLTPKASNSLVRTEMKFFFDDEYADMTSYFFDRLQRNLECCGVYGPGDFAEIFHNPDQVPESCCREDVNKCDSGYAYKNGCYNQLTAYVDNSVQLIGIVTLAVAATEVLGTIFAFCLARQSKEDKINYLFKY